jgi:hypothetical protein
MKKMFHLSLIALIICNYTSFAQTINSVKISKFKNGLYTLKVFFNSKIDSSYKDLSLFTITDSYNYRVELPKPTFMGQENNALKFTGLSISYNQSYKLHFIDTTIIIDSTKYENLGGKGTEYEEYESKYSLDWNWSATPKLIQSDSSNNSLGDLGLSLEAVANFSGIFNLNFDGNVSSKKDDPNNTVKLNISAHTQLVPVIKDLLKIRPLLFRMQENTTQILKYHDLSGSAITTFIIIPSKGIQHIFLTVAYDYANIIQQNQEPFRESRFNVEILWGFEGLIGKGTSFNADWQYWNRLATTASYEQTNKKERKLLSLELKIPVDNDKCMNIKYQDGDIAPLFINSTSFSLGLQIALASLNLLSGK